LGHVDCVITDVFVRSTGLRSEILGDALGFIGSTKYHLGPTSKWDRPLSGRRSHRIDSSPGQSKFSFTMADDNMTKVKANAKEIAKKNNPLDGNLANTPKETENVASSTLIVITLKAGLFIIFWTGFTLWFQKTFVL
jgi:hypothetical protein